MSRDAIFARLRSHRDTGDEVAAHIVPQRARVTGADAVTSFITHLESHGVCVEQLSTAALVPSVVQRHLEAARLPPTVRMGHERRLTSLPWAEATSLTCLEGRAAPGDLAAISVAIAGIAETGTLVLMSGAENPSTLAFMPDVHFVMISAADISGAMEDAFKRVTTLSGSSPWPRAVHLISAASRTGDIGGQLVMGAHGPRQLVVLIVEATRI